MASSIQLFKSVRKYFQLLGIDQPPLNGTSLIHWRISLALFWYIQHFITVFAFFIFEARTVIEYGTSFFGFIMMIYCVLYFLILIWQRPRIFQLIESFEQFIQQSKCSRVK